jgi:hypothetical protein
LACNKKQVLCECQNLAPQFLFMYWPPLSCVFSFVHSDGTPMIDLHFVFSRVCVCDEQSRFFEILRVQYEFVVRYVSFKSC